MSAIIFGANGQDGYYLNALLQRQGIAVTGVSRSGPWLNGSVSDYAFVKALIKEQQPAYIFHLAANSTAAHEAWEENHHTISDGTLYLLENVKEHSPYAKVFLSGSGLQFENKGLPIRETDAFAATSPYAVSRIQSAYAARYYRSLGIKAYVGYFFNHESPLRSERHMSKKIAAFARRIAAGSNEQLTIGDMTVEKEWTFAGDAVTAIWQLMQQDNTFESVIGNGTGHTIKDWLDECFAIAGIDWQPYVQHQQGFIPQYQRLISNPETLHNLGWQPAVNFGQLAAIMMNV